MTKKTPPRQPADRTIAIHIAPPVPGADVEVQVAADPNLWLHGTTDAQGYVAWQWSDSLGDSAIRVRAAEYEPYLESCHWKTYTDPDVGPSPLNHQLTIGEGGDLPPLEPLAPPVPEPGPIEPAQEFGILRVDRPTIRDENGDCWQWRGFTDFLLFYRFLCGIDITPFLTERISLGANILRVFSMVGWDECQPPFYPQNWGDAYYAKLREFADRLALAKLRLELTVFADAGLVMPDATERKDHLRRCLTALSGCWNVVIEIGNETFKTSNLPGGDAEAIDLAHAAQGHGFLIASGEYDSWPPDPTADYGTSHCDRTTDWPRKCKDLKDRCDESGQTPWIGDEPMGANEVYEPGRRDTDPDNFAWYASGSQMFGPGATFHCEDGIHSRTPIGSTQAACARAFFWALDWTPVDALVMPYQRGGDPGTGGIGEMPIEHTDLSIDPEHGAVRSYCKGNGTQEWCIAIQCGPQWTAIPRDGWRVVSVPRRGFVYLEKP